MRKLIVIFLLLAHGSPAQTGWTQKANYGGTWRAQATSFVIGDKAYVGTGVNANGEQRDFWQWDQANNTWTQIADFPGDFRIAAFGFAIGSTGYVGGGVEQNAVQNQPTLDFWAWDQLTNSWSQKGDLPAQINSPATFTIDQTAYLVTGNSPLGDSITGHSDFFWSYDAATDTWAWLPPFPGAARSGAVGFSIDKKGYVLSGYAAANLCNDLWEWDQSSGIWTQKAPIPTSGWGLAAGFSIGARGYIGTGYHFSASYNQDFWEWDQATDSWTQKQAVGLPNNPRAYCFGFAINNKGYIGGGQNPDASYRNDFWEYTPDTVTSVAEIREVGFATLLPNPATDFLLVRLPSEIPAGASLRVFDLSGKCLLTKIVTARETKLDVSSYPAGVYFVGIEAGTHLYRQKFLRE